MIWGPLGFLFSEDINIYLQGIGNPFIDLLFLAVTNIFSEPGFLLIATVIFWCFDKKTGIRLMYVVLLSSFIAIFAKNLFGMPRPPEYLQKIKEPGFGFPSGHALISSGFWGYLAGNVKNPRIVIFGAASILAVSLSRIYLGVHYAGDVLGGIVLGLLTAFILLKTESGITATFNRFSYKSKYLVVVLFPSILTALAFFQPGLIMDQLETGIVMASVGTGYILQEGYIRLEDAKNNKQRFNRAIAGMLLLAIVYLISSIIFLNFSFFVHAMLGLTSTLIAPWIFDKMEIRSKSSSATN